ncbi:MAG: D-alanyl-lipoteichoic acid biosynthesis protein DltB, partial [Macrococcoides caseolyticum]
MIPYGDFQFFFIALALLIPVIVLGFCGRRNHYYNWFVTVIMLILIFKDPNKNLFGISILSFEMISFIIYIIYQLIIISSYLKLVKRKNTLSLFIIFLVLSIAPLAAVKVIQSSLFGFTGHLGEFSIKSLIG